MTPPPAAGPAPAAGVGHLSTRRFAVALALLALLAFGIHAEGLRGGFVFDDHSLIVENEHLGDWSHVPHLFRAAWRPLKRLSFMVDNALWGLDPVGFHLTNILLHAAAVVAAAACLAALGVARRTSVVAAALFAVHPMTVEAVAVVTHRKEMMGTLFLCLALALHARPRASALSVAGTWFLFIASILSKEVIGAAFPALALAYDLLIRDGAWRANLRRSLLIVAPLGAGVLAVLFGRLAYQEKSTLLPFFEPDHLFEISSGIATTWQPVLGAAGRALWTDLWLLAWPVAPCADRPFAVLATPWDAASLAALAGGVALAVAAVVLRRRWPDLSLATAWVLVTVAPVVNLLPLSHWFVAERFLYAPAVGASLAAATLLARLGTLKAVSTRAPWLPGLMVVALIVAGSAISVRRTADWRSDLAIWTVTFEQVPDSIIANSGLATFHQQSGRLAESAAAWSRVLERRPQDPKALINGGDALMRLGRIPEATLLLEQAAAIEPDAADVHNNLGNCYKMAGRVQDAWRQHALAARLGPHLAEPRVNLASTLVQRGDMQGAVRWLEEALVLEPGLATAHFNLALVRADLGEVEAARLHLRRVLQLEAPTALKDRARRALAALSAEGD